jgi:formyl-CoA transferase
MTQTTKPLAGVKVLELGTLIAGPFAARIMAEFGAEVIKIESPDGGDPLRQWRKLYEGTSLWWYLQARNKKSVTVNLKHPEGVAIVKALAREADIVVENFRPGVLEKRCRRRTPISSCCASRASARAARWPRSRASAPSANRWAGCAT